MNLLSFVEQNVIFAYAINTELTGRKNVMLFDVVILTFENLRTNNMHLFRSEQEIFDCITHATVGLGRRGVAELEGNDGVNSLITLHCPLPEEALELGRKWEKIMWKLPSA